MGVACGRVPAAEAMAAAGAAAAAAAEAGAAAEVARGGYGPRGKRRRVLAPTYTPSEMGPQAHRETRERRGKKVSLGDTQLSRGGLGPIRATHEPRTQTASKVAQSDANGVVRM